ncbi:GerAB/ArcD/ProY family transporter [Metabacillus halosaccharovorans]|uniref:GerAB/ArcD/ProY family transporter n=1 Tax=Metabacillus halosaccharovorans TaxID=930124 RepID=UPI000995A149|nr:GerAB/ArcD/ProY family transporter [Metabacillus halosaccharovorans]
MGKEKKDKISYLQLICMIVQTQIGVGILSLPHDVALVSKNDGWISTLIAGVVVQVIIFILWSLFKRFPNLTFYEIIIELLGKKIGKLFILFYIAYFVLTGSFVLIRYSQVINIWILQKTPKWVMILLMIIVCMYIVKGSFRAIARFYVFVTPLLLIFVALITYSLKDSNILYIFPIGINGFSNIIKGSKEATFAMIGFEIVFLLYPLLRESNSKKLKGMSVANIIVTLLYSYLVFSSLIYFETSQDLFLTPQPLLYMIKAYSFQILERTDLFFLSIWIVCVATSIGSWLLLSANALKTILQKPNHNKYIPYMGLSFFLITLFPINETNIETFNKLLNPAHYFFLVIFPFFLLVISFGLSKIKVGEMKE